MTVWERLVGYVEREGFTCLKSFEGTGTAYFRQDNQKLYAVFLMWEPMAAGVRPEDYLRWKRETEELLYYLYQKNPIWLGILCASEPTAYRDWCRDGQLWLIESWSGRVILYENQAAGFLGWERSLERVLETEQEPIRSKTASSDAPIMTIILLVVNIIIFCTLELLPQDTSAKLYSDGVMYWPAVTEEGQYYRMLTSMFLHFDSSHLMNNMLMLFLIGSRLEKLLGRIQFSAIYFLSGMIADLASMGYTMLQNRLVISAGASGAVFGIVGSLAWIVIANKGKVEGMTSGWMVIFVGLSLYGGFANQRTDNAAHIGGFLAGLLLTILLYKIRGARKHHL